MNDSHQFVSVIVPVYNGAKFIGRCLDALLSNRYPWFEIIVINDGSTDETEDICRAKRVVVLQSERARSGPAAARNLAAHQARGDVLMFVDADVVVEPDTISKVAECFAREADLAALFGSYDNAPGETNFLSQYKNLQHHFVHQTSNPEASTFWAGLGAIRADVFASVGGFDVEKFAVPSIEDIELGARLRKAGYRILLERSIQAKHLKRWSTWSLLRTDILCRAVPWSKLILTSQGLINDMNLKTNDRACAALVAIILLLVPISFWQPFALMAILIALAAFVYLNRSILSFYLRERGLLFAAMAVPWQLLYFLYSGTAFIVCWCLYSLPATIGLVRREVS